MKFVLLYLIVSIYYISVHSLYLDDNNDEDWYAIFQDRDVNRIDERDDSAIETDKQKRNYITIQADRNLLESRVNNDNPCDIKDIDRDGIEGVECQRKAYDGSKCYLSRQKKIECETVHMKITNKGKIKSICDCRFIAHVDKC